MSSVDQDREVLARHIRLIQTDTGYCCRNLLGWNYDEYGGVKTNVGTGGVRRDGSHQRMVEVIDNPATRFKLIEAPRGSYKSTIIQGKCISAILANPNIRIYYVAKTDKMALEKSTAIRAALESEAVTTLFGSQVGAPWEVDRFTVSGRTQATLQTPTFSTFSMESMPTGGRADLLIVDDPIDQESCTTPEMIEKSKRQWAMLHPFLAKGGTMIVVGTRYAADDLFNDLEQSPLFAPPRGESFVIGAGVHVVRDDKTGTLTIEPDSTGLTFPHMTMDFLQEKFAGMVRAGRYVEFSCQYLNVVPSASGSIFHRWMFQPIPWGRDMEQLSGYILTDTATSQRDQGCYSVVAYVALDAVDNLYVLDLRVGHWDPSGFVDQFLDVFETWEPKLNHIGEVWEEVALAQSFEFAIRDRARARKLRLNTIRIKRMAQDKKDSRILRMHAPMHDRKLFIVDTVPQFFDDLDGPRLLWDKEGYLDARSKIRQPGGELVDEFVRFKASGVKKDVADTLAMALEFDKVAGKHRRFCTFRPSRKQRVESLTQQRVQEYRALHYPAANGAIGTSWWENTIREQRGNI